MCEDILRSMPFRVRLIRQQLVGGSTRSYHLHIGMLPSYTHLPWLFKASTNSRFPLVHFFSYPFFAMSL
jgi:hypothetical protein